MSRPSRALARRLPALVLAALALPFGAAHAQNGGAVAEWEPPPTRDDAFALTIRSIMRGPELVGDAPSGVRFTDDSRWIYFRWLPGGRSWDDDPDLWRIPAAGGSPEAVPDEAADSVYALLAGGAPGDLSPDRSLRVAAWQGDLWLVHRDDLRVVRLTETRAQESAPRFTPTGDRVLYRSGDNVFSLGIAGGPIRQVTDIRAGNAPAEPDSAEGHRAFLERQQEELFEHVQREKAREARQDSLRDARLEAGAEPFWVGQGRSVETLAPSPDGRRALIETTRPGEDARQTLVPAWVTGSGYTEELTVRTKVGDAPEEAGVVLLETGTGDTTWIRPAPADHEGPVRLSVGDWNDAGTHALLQGRSDDDQRWWLWSLEAATGSLTLLDELSDDAWVAGPCGGCRGWIPDTERVWYVSEATGFAHLYTVDADGSDRRALTSGEWEVLDVVLPEGTERFLLTTNEASPFTQHVAWLSFDGRSKEEVTGGRGAWDAVVSPDGERLALVHSRANRPPELFVAAADRPGEVTRVTTSPTEAWSSFPWLEPEIVHVPAADGTPVPARVYRPRELGASANGAGVVFVHGAGYLHNVHDHWSSYYREYMYHHFLAAAGYTVLDLDYRGSAGYGRDWRTAIYRHMGGLDLSDQVDGARWLVAQEGVDAGRIGIYGGSYGGFITLMALFTADDTFKSGAALRSVTDWAHYNDNYTSNILNDPQEDEEAYRRSSPIYFAEGLRPDQHLLMLHGMVDTNVHFSDVVRLAQRLIELGKENWELAVYPVENHGFSAPSSWTDEYRRIFELFERTLSRPGCTEGGDLCPVPAAGG